MFDKKYMKKLLLLLFSGFLFSCSEAETFDESVPVVSQNVNISLVVLNENGEKVLLNGDLKRDDVSVEYKINNIYEPAATSWCYNDDGGLVLYNRVANDRGTTSCKLTFPNNEVFYIDFSFEKEPGEFIWFVNNVTINNDVVYEGGSREPGTYNECSALQINLVLNQ